MLLGNFTQYGGCALARTREENVDLAFFPLDGIEQTIKVVEIGRVTLDTGDVPADQLDGLVKCLLSPASDEHVRAFLNESFCGRQRQAA